MNNIEVLPNPKISSSGVISQQFYHRNLTTFHQACHWVKNLPYGSNSSNALILVMMREHPILEEKQKKKKQRKNDSQTKRRVEIEKS